MAKAPSASRQSDKDADQDELIHYELKDGVATLSMRYRPYNLIGVKLLSAISKLLERANTENARAIVIRSGIRHFSAGADLDQFQQRADRGSQSPSKSTDEAYEKSYVTKFLHRMEQLPIPIIASVHGVCLGGGLELALACDYIIAAQSAKLGSVEATLGLQPIMGGVQRQVQRVGMARAKEMSMLARRYDAATLERWGLINLVVDDDRLEAVTETVAREFASGPTVSYAATKQLAFIAANDGVSAADEAMAGIQKPIWASEDLKTGLASFMKNGPGMAKFEGR
ncbi:MAG: enoyl-CoA hydratase [Hyphococcus sp.]|nr:MAG: enoyl-CoA hydratase [Marinicaulis sp.]